MKPIPPKIINNAVEILNRGSAANWIKDVEPNKSNPQLLKADIDWNTPYPKESTHE